MKSGKKANQARLEKSPKFYVDEVTTASSRDSGPGLAVKTQGEAVPGRISRGISGIQGLGTRGGRECVAGRRLMERVRSPSFSDEKGPMSSIMMNAGPDSPMLLSNLQLPSCC